MLSEQVIEERGVLFKRDGLFYVRLQCSRSGEPFEIALHGVMSEEHALAAAEVLFISKDQSAFPHFFRGSKRKEAT